MSRFDCRTRECYLVVRPRPEGPTVGVYADRPISELVVDYFGRRFTFIGVAPRRSNGQYDLAALRKGQFIVKPGLLYQIVTSERRLRRAPCPNNSKLEAEPNVAHLELPDEHKVAPAGVIELRDEQSERKAPEPLLSNQGQQLAREIAASVVALLSVALVAQLLFNVLHVY